MKRRIKLTESSLNRIIKKSIKNVFESRNFDDFFDTVDNGSKDNGNGGFMDGCGDEITDLCNELKNSALCGNSKEVMQYAKEIAKRADEISDYLNQQYQTY